MCGELEGLGGDLLNSLYTLKNNKVVNKLTNRVEYACGLEKLIIKYLTVDKQLSHIIVYKWLYNQGMVDILYNWEGPKYYNRVMYDNNITVSRSNVGVYYKWDHGRN